MNQAPELSSEPRLNLSGQSAEVRYTLQFVIWKLDMEMIFQFREQIERLQAVNSESLEKISVRMQIFSRHFEVRSGKVQDLVESLISSGHRFLQIVCHSGRPYVLIVIPNGFSREESAFVCRSSEL